MILVTTSEGFSPWVLPECSCKTRSQKQPQIVPNTPNMTPSNFLRKSPNSLVIDSGVHTNTHACTHAWTTKPLVPTNSPPGRPRLRKPDPSRPEDRPLRPKDGLQDRTTTPKTAPILHLDKACCLRLFARFRNCIACSCGIGLTPFCQRSLLSSNTLKSRISKGHPVGHLAAHCR